MCGQAEGYQLTNTKDDSRSTCAQISAAALMRQLHVFVLLVLMFLGGRAGATPFAYISNYGDNTVSANRSAVCGEGGIHNTWLASAFIARLPPNLPPIGHAYLK